MTINVIYIVDKLEIGGAENIVSSLALNLNQKIYKSHVCCLERLGALGIELRAKGIPVYCLHSKQGADFLLSFRLARLFRKLNIQIAHAHNSTAYRHTVIASLIARIPIVVQTRHGDELIFESYWRNLLQRFLSYHADTIVCICEHLKKKDYK